MTREASYTKTPPKFDIVDCVKSGNHRLARLMLRSVERERDEAKRMLDLVFEHCVVVLHDRKGVPPEYPLEHQPLAGKDMRDYIEAKLKELNQ